MDRRCCIEACVRQPLHSAEIDGGRWFELWRSAETRRGLLSMRRLAAQYVVASCSSDHENVSHGARSASQFHTADEMRLMMQMVSDVRHMLRRHHSPSIIIFLSSIFLLLTVHGVYCISWRDVDACQSSTVRSLSVTCRCHKIMLKYFICICKIWCGHFIN